MKQNLYLLINRFKDILELNDKLISLKNDQQGLLFKGSKDDIITNENDQLNKKFKEFLSFFKMNDSLSDDFFWSIKNTFEKIDDLTFNESISNSNNYFNFFHKLRIFKNVNGLQTSNDKKFIAELEKIKNS